MSALCLAQIVKNSLPENTSNTKGTIQFFVSKNPNEFILSAKTFFDVKEAQLVEL